MPLAESAEKLVWSRPPDMPGVEILAAENSQRLWCVYHQTYTVCTIVKHAGYSEWAYRGKRHRIGDQRIMLMEPGELHRNIRHTAKGDFFVVQVNPSLVESLARESGLKVTPHFKVAQSANNAIFHAFAQFHSVVADGGSLLERQSLLAGAMGRLLKECSESGLRPEPSHFPAALGRARDYLHAHFYDGIALDELAGIAGLSRFHFLRTFARQFGLPPHQYQINLRVEKTRALLKAGVPVGEIEAGFTDQPHLIRHFKRVMGVTPGQYASMTCPRRARLSIVV